MGALVCSPLKKMKNRYGIPEIALTRIRKRDTHCVYCGVFMPDRAGKANTKSFASIEHLYPPGSDPAWVCFCCNECNAAHRMPLPEWFKTEYCLTRNINEKTVAELVKRFLKSGLKEYDQMWVDGSTHDFILRADWKTSATDTGIAFLKRSTLCESEKKCFDKIADEIRDPEFIRWNPSRDPKLSRYNGYEYWIEGEIIYRREFKSKCGVVE